MEPPSFPPSGLFTVRAAPGSDATLVLPLPSGTPPFNYQWSRAGASLDERFTATDDAGGVRLTVAAARTGDTNVYTLLASNAAGSDTSRVRLEVSADEAPTGDDPPTFLRRLQDLTVKVGTRTRFLVEIVSSTECKVTWFRNERRLLEAERVALARDGNFWCADVAAVSVDDAGRWTCTAENAGGRASCSAHLNVLVPKAYKRPEFVEELRALLTEQGTVSLECKVVGVPTPVLRWFKDSREIKAGDVFALTANAEDPTSLGTYTCEAVNCMGRAYSSSKVHVVGRSSREGSARPSSSSVTLEPPPIFTKELEDQFVRICEPLTLGCHIVVPPWPRSVVWYNKEGKIEPSERYHVLEDGAGGYLLEVPSAEWPDEGEWKCVATSTGGRVGISTCYVAMDVPKNYRKPRFMENLQAVLTEEGLVSFECKVVGFPTPVLSWFKDGQELKPGDVYQLTGTNSLGSYCCIARNCMGQASSSAELTVEDIQNQLNEEEKLQLFSKNQAPKFIQGLKSVEAKIDESFRFTVKVAIPPEPSVLWYRDDQPVDESSRCHHGREDRGVFYLDIQSLEFLDQAEWKCVAMNDFGHSVTSCFLKLIIPRHYKKPRFLENLQAILSDEGAVNLECKVIGVPQPILKWYKDGEELKPGDIHRIISGQDGTCCLGTYTCEAQNCMGIAASSASLLGFDDSMKAKKKKAEEQALQRNLSLSTIHEERTSQMYDTPVGDVTTFDDKGEISFSFDGKEVSVSLYETPDLTEEEALQIVEMYADQLSENITEHNVVELPPLRFVKETSTSGNLLMEAVIIDVSPDYFVSPDEDMRTEADIEDISIADENGPPQLSLDQDFEIGGEDYLEKTMALLSEEKSDISLKLSRKKSDSQRSADDFFSLSRDQSLSEEKKDDDTQAISDMQSFASAHSSGKPKSKSLKPSEEEGQESSDPTKTILFKDETLKHALDTEPSPLIKPKRERRTSRSSRRSSSGSEKSVTKSREEPLIKKESFEIEIPIKPKITDEEFKHKMMNISISLTKVINGIQIIERDIILKSELMSSAATASRSLEIISSLISPLSEIHSIADAAKESTTWNKEVSSTLFNCLPQPLKSLQQSLTIIEKCIDMESDSKTLVKKTCVAFIETCGSEMQKLISDINSITFKDYLNTEDRVLTEIESLNNEISTVIKFSADTIKARNLLSEASEIKMDEPSLEDKHLKDTQKAIFELKSPLNSLLCIAESTDSGKTIDVAKVRNSEVILNDMSGSIQDLQTALEQIETLSVKESTMPVHKYNTEIIETVMESVVKLRSSFEQLSIETEGEDNTVLKQAVASIKENLNKISSQIEVIEKSVGTFDVLQSENKLYALQKMAQILISLENNLPRLEPMQEVKNRMTIFHKNLTKVLENVIESNESKKYFCLMEICDAVNRMNASIKSLDVDNILPLASLNNTLRIIQDQLITNVFDSELNCSLLTNVTDTLVGIQEAINTAEEISIQIDSEHLQSIALGEYKVTKAKFVVEHIEHAIAAIENVKVIESTQNLKLNVTPTLENICPVLEELKISIASMKASGIDEEHISDISEVPSFPQTFALPLCELNQNLIVLNQQIIENIESIKQNSEVMATIAVPLHELHTTLVILQQDVISQYGEDLTPYDVSINMASAVQNLQSCIVMVQEQTGVEAADDMSTLEDISGIKTTADTLPSDRLVLPTAEETAIEQTILPFTQELQTTATAQALQILNDHIIVLQNPNVIDALDTLSEVSDYSSLKSFVIGLGELHSGIEEVLHPLLMEGSNEIANLINPSKLLAIAEPMQELQQSLSVLDTSNIPIYENLLEMPTERIHSVIQSVSEFKEHLDKCMFTMFPAMHTANNTVEIANKVGTLREVCEHLKDIIETTRTVEIVNMPEEVKALEHTIDILLEATDVSKGIKIEQVKMITAELYGKVVTVQEELIQFTPKTPEKLAQEAKLIQTIVEVQSNIAVLEQYDFVDLSRASELTCASPQVALEIESDSLMLMEDIVDSAVNVVHDSSQDMPIADLMIVEDFFKTCKNEFTILRCLISKATTHKKIIRLLQEFNSLQSTINDFKIKKIELNLSDDVNGCLATFLIHADDCLQNVQTSLVKIVDSQAGLLIETPLAKFENSAKVLNAAKETKQGEKIVETIKKFVEILSVVKPSMQHVQADVLDEIKYGKVNVVEDSPLVAMIDEFATYVEVAKTQNESIETKALLEKVSSCIEKHQDFKDANGTGKTLILLKCLSDCTDVLNEGLLEMKIPKQKVEEGPLKAVLTEILEPLQALHSQLTIVQEQVLKGVDEDSISVDITTTESLVQTMTEKHKEIIERMETEKAIANEEIYLIMKVDKEIHSIQDSLRSIENVQVAQIVKEIAKPVEEIEKSMHEILSSDKVSVSSEDKVPKGSAEELIRHIDQYIELIEIVEEISAIIKINDVKETMDIAKELRESIAISETATEEVTSKQTIEERQKQSRLAQRFQTALLALQVQVFDSAQEIAPALSAEVLQRIAKVTAQLQADLVAVTGIQVAVQAPAEFLTNVSKTIEVVEGQTVIATPELIIAAAESEATILEQVGVIKQMASSDELLATKVLIEKTIAETKEIVTSENVELLLTETSTKCGQVKIEGAIAIEGTEATLVEQTEATLTEATHKEDAKLSLADQVQAQEVAASTILKTESVSAVIIEDLGPEMHEVTLDDQQIQISQVADIQELPKATIDILVQHIDQFMSGDITEIITELSNVMNKEELKQSISIAKELRENIAASEVELKAETSDVLRDEIIAQQAHLAQQLYTALTSLDTLPIDSLKEISSISQDTVQRVTEITENLRADLAVVTAIQNVVDQTQEIVSETAEQKCELEAGVMTLSTEQIKSATCKTSLSEDDVQEKKHLDSQITIIETIEASPIKIDETMAVTAEQRVQEESLRKATIETLLQNIEEFLSDNIVQTVDQMSSILNVDEIKQSIAVACDLRQSFTVTVSQTEASSIKDQDLREQALLVQQLQNYLCIIQAFVLESTNELDSTLDKNLVQQFIHTTTQLSSELAAMSQLFTEQKSMTDVTEISTETKSDLIPIEKMELAYDSKSKNGQKNINDNVLSSNIVSEIISGDSYGQINLLTKEISNITEDVIQTIENAEIQQLFEECVKNEEIIEQLTTEKAETAIIDENVTKITLIDEKLKELLEHSELKKVVEATTITIITEKSQAAIQNITATTKETTELKDELIQKNTENKIIPNVATEKDLAEDSLAQPEEIIEPIYKTIGLPNAEILQIETSGLFVQETSTITETQVDSESKEDTKQLQSQENICTKLATNEPSTLTEEVLGTLISEEITSPTTQEKVLEQQDIEIMNKELISVVPDVSIEGLATEIIENNNNVLSTTKAIDKQYVPENFDYINVVVSGNANLEVENTMLAEAMLVEQTPQESAKTSPSLIASQLTNTPPSITDKENTLMKIIEGNLVESLTQTDDRATAENLNVTHKPTPIEPNQYELEVINKLSVSDDMETEVAKAAEQTLELEPKASEVAFCFTQLEFESIKPVSAIDESQLSHQDKITAEKILTDITPVGKDIATEDHNKSLVRENITNKNINPDKLITMEPQIVETSVQLVAENLDKTEPQYIEKIDVADISNAETKQVESKQRQLVITTKTGLLSEILHPTASVDDVFKVSEKLSRTSDDIIENVEVLELEPVTKQCEVKEDAKTSIAMTTYSSDASVLTATCQMVLEYETSQPAQTSKVTLERGDIIEHINEFVSEDISELVSRISELTNNQELKESVKLAKALKENIEIVSTIEEPGILEEAKMEQAKVVQKLQDALSTLLTKTLENTEEIAPIAEPHGLQRISEIITHLQEDLETTALVSSSPDVLKAPEIVQIPETEDSMKQLEMLLQEVTDKINIATVREVEDTESLRDALDEVQTVIIKLKRDYDGAANDTLNETLEDLECSVRSVQLQINEDSPPELLKEACATLQLLVNNMSETQEVRVLETTPVEMKEENILRVCATETDETVKLLEQAFKSYDQDSNLAGIVSSLSNLRETMKTLRLSFVGSADILIEKGVDVVQNLDQLEEKVFTLEKDLSEVTLSTETRDHILTAVHSVYGSISNMRGTISSIQKKYMFENYGKPSETLLKSIKNVTTILDYVDENKQNWKAFSKSLRKVLNHFEDIKFYINLDKTARLPSDAAFTKIILEELKCNICDVLVQQTSLLGTEASKKVDNLLEYVKNSLANIEVRTHLEVKEKIPIFKKISAQLFDVTNFIKSQLCELLNDTKTKITAKTQEITVDQEIIDDKEIITKDSASDPISKEEPLSTVAETEQIAEDKIEIVKDAVQFELPSTSKLIPEDTSEVKPRIRKQVLVQEMDFDTQVRQIATELVDKIAAEAIAVIQDFGELATIENTILHEDIPTETEVVDSKITKSESVVEEVVPVFDNVQTRSALHTDEIQIEELPATTSKLESEQIEVHVDYTAEEQNKDTENSSLQYKQEAGVSHQIEKSKDKHTDVDQSNEIVDKTTLETDKKETKLEKHISSTTEDKVTQKLLTKELEENISEFENAGASTSITRMKQSQEAILETTSNEEENTGLDSENKETAMKEKLADTEKLEEKLLHEQEAILKKEETETINVQIWQENEKLEREKEEKCGEKVKSEPEHVLQSQTEEFQNKFNGVKPKPTHVDRTKVQEVLEQAKQDNDIVQEQTITSKTEEMASKATKSTKDLDKKIAEIEQETKSSTELAVKSKTEVKEVISDVDLQQEAIEADIKENEETSITEIKQDHKTEDDVIENKSTIKQKKTLEKEASLEAKRNENEETEKKLEVEEQCKTEKETEKQELAPKEDTDNEQQQPKAETKIEDEKPKEDTKNKQLTKNTKVKEDAKSEVEQKLLEDKEQVDLKKKENTANLEKVQADAERERIKQERTEETEKKRVDDEERVKKENEAEQKFKLEAERKEENAAKLENEKKEAEMKLQVEEKQKEEADKKKLAKKKKREEEGKVKLEAEIKQKEETDKFEMERVEAEKKQMDDIEKKRSEDEEREKKEREEAEKHKLDTETKQKVEADKQEQDRIIIVNKQKDEIEEKQLEVKEGEKTEEEPEKQKIEAEKKQKEEPENKKLKHERRDKKQKEELETQELEQKWKEDEKKEKLEAEIKQKEETAKHKTEPVETEQNQKEKDEKKRLESKEKDKKEIETEKQKLEHKKKEDEEIAKVEAERNEKLRLKAEVEDAKKKILEDKKKENKEEVEKNRLEAEGKQKEEVEKLEQERINAEKKQEEIAEMKMLAKRNMKEEQVQLEAEKKEKAEKERLENEETDRKEIEEAKKQKQDDEKKQKEEAEKTMLVEQKKKEEEQAQLEAKRKQKEESEKKRLEDEEKEKKAIEEAENQKLGDERKQKEAAKKLEQERNNTRIKEKEEAEKKKLAEQKKREEEEAKLKTEKKQKEEAEKKRLEDEEKEKKAIEKADRLEQERINTEKKQKQEEEKKTLAEQKKKEEKVKFETEKEETEKQKIEADLKQKEEAKNKKLQKQKKKEEEEKAKMEAEGQQKEEDERQKLEIERKQKEEAEKKRLEEEKKAKEETEKLEQERISNEKQQEEEAEKIKLEKQKKKEEEKKAIMEAEGKQKEEDEKQNLETESKRKKEAEKKRLEDEKKAKEEAEKLEQERISNEKKQKEESEKIKLEKQKKKEEEEKAKMEAEGKQKEEDERQKLEIERNQKEEAEKKRLEEEKKAKEETEKLEQERISNEKQQKEEAEKIKLEKQKKKEEEKKAIMEAEGKQKEEDEKQKLETERKRKKEAEKKRLEDEKKAKEEADKLEQERISKEKKQKEEAEKIKLEKQKKKKEEEKAKMEAEGKQKQEDEKQKLETERKQKEEADKLEQERLTTEKRQKEQADKKQLDYKEKDKKEIEETAKQKLEVERKQKEDEELIKLEKERKQKKEAHMLEMKRVEAENKQKEEAVKKQLEDEERDKKEKEAERQKFEAERIQKYEAEKQNLELEKTENEEKTKLEADKLEKEIEEAESKRLEAKNLKEEAEKKKKKEEEKAKLEGETKQKEVADMKRIQDEKQKLEEKKKDDEVKAKLETERKQMEEAEKKRLKDEENDKKEKIAEKQKLEVERKPKGVAEKKNLTKNKKEEEERAKLGEERKQKEETDKLEMERTEVENKLKEEEERLKTERGESKKKREEEDKQREETQTKEKKLKDDKKKRKQEEIMKGEQEAASIKEKEAAQIDRQEKEKIEKEKQEAKQKDEKLKQEEKREKERKKLEKDKQEETLREEEEKARLEKKRTAKKKREDEEARLKTEAEESEIARKAASKKRKDEEKARLNNEQEQAEIREQEIRDTERRKREERRKQIEQDLNETKTEQKSTTLLRSRKEENGDVSANRKTDDEGHYIREYQYEPTRQASDERNKFVDHDRRDYTMEFLRPSGYREKTFEHEQYSERQTLGKSATIYKAQTIILDSQFRSSVPPLPDRSESERRDRFDRSDSERRVERQRLKAASEAKSLISEKRSSLSRDLKRKPVFSTYLTDRTAVEGSRVKLTCSVLSYSDPKITWYKNGIVIDNKLKYRTKFLDGLITLEVLNAVVSDSAEYSCTVENENGSVNTSANLKVYPSFEASPIPPTFTRSIRDTYHLAENELVLECRIRGQPLPTITWLKDDKPVSTNERYQAYYLADGVCRLAISSPTPEDSGKYTCKAENSVWSDQITHIVSFTGKESRLSPNLATIERSRFNRQALESRRPHFTNVLSDYKVTRGGTIGLQVEIRGCPTRVEWLREGHSVTELYRNAQTFVEQGLYTLALSDVTEKESGMYTCRAWSTHGNVDMNAAITVVPPNELEGKPAIIVGRPDKDILISVGEDVNISFRVQGEPKPKVVFMKGIRDITTSQRVCKMTSDDYVKFTLKRSVVSDAGTYCILARNAYGCDRAFVTVVVRQRASSDNLISDWTYPMDDSALSIADRKYKSVPDRIPGEPSVVDGGNNWVSLAWPKADPRDTAPVLAYRIESWLVGKEGGARWVELGITPLNSFDAFNLKQGEEYHFRVTPRNRYGWGESVQTSTPFGIGLAGDRPEFVDILPGQLKVLVGETANLSCSVKGKPSPEIVWMKNGHEIEEESRMTSLYNGQDCSLTIKDICIEDEARYSCEATNVHGRASTYARLAVVTDRLIWEADAKLKRERSQDAEGDYPPQFTMRLRDRRVQATYPVRLTCQVVGNPPPTLTWFKDGEVLVFDCRRNKYQDEHFQTLEIAPTTLEDGGIYEAMARNSSGAVSCRCSLVVDKGIRAYVAPEFCCGLEPLYRVAEGGELRISAVVEAYPSVGVTWYRDGVRLRPSRRAIMTLDRDGQIELALASVTARDAGVYTCTASNEVGRASTSGKVEVWEGDQPREKRTPPVVINAPDVPYSKEPMFVRKPRSSEAREGDTVIIACEVIGDPKPDVYWLRDFLKPDYYRDATHFKRVGDGPEYRFEIPHAKLDYTGAYSVVARNVHGETKAIISLQILAKDPSSTDDSHNVRYGRVEVIPRFERELTDLLSYDGDAVEFECHVTGNPEPDIRWFHYNELIRDCPDFESSFDHGAARLKIKQVTAEDEGTYSCEASNNLGKATSSACLVVYPPGEPNTLSQRLRRPLALLSAASTPRSTPRSTPARSVSRTPGPDSHRLCSPSRQMAPSFYTYPFNKVVEEGDHVTFKCAVKGLPAPWATWDKDGIIITPSTRITIREKDELLRILEIEQVSIEDVGVYRITIENEFGRAEASARLEVITQKGKFYGGVRAYSASPRKSLTYRRYPSVPRQD